MQENTLMTTMSVRILVIPHNNNNNNNNNNSILYFYVLHQHLKGQLQTQHNKYNSKNVN
jgi:hypothetical protein